MSWALQTCAGGMIAVCAGSAGGALKVQGLVSLLLPPLHSCERHSDDITNRRRKAVVVV